MILNISNHKQLVKRGWFLLLPLLALFPFFIMGQTDTMIKNTILPLTIIYEGDGGEYAEEWKPSTDTVKVIILVSYTAEIGNPNIVKIMIGYQVSFIEYKNGFYIGRTETYLDQDKKPLKKSLVVWMTKEIKY